MIKIVEKFELNQPTKVIRTLPVDTFRQLKKNINQKENQKELSRLYYDKHWFLCNCKHQSPTYVKKIKATSTFILSRVPYRKEHENDCVFYRLEANNPIITTGQAKYNGPTFNTYNFEYNFQYRKSFFKSNNEKSRISVISQDDEFYVFSKTILGNSRLNLDKKQYYSQSDIELRSAQFILNKKGLYNYLALDLTKQYQQLKSKLTQQIKSGEDKLPIGLAISHIHSLQSDNNGKAALIVFKSKKESSKDFTITLPRNTTITSLTKKINNGPLIAAIIMGKTGQNEKTGEPYIGPLHVLLMTALDHNSHYCVSGSFSRAFIRTLFSQKEEHSDLNNIIINSSYLNEEAEVLDININQKRYVIHFSPQVPSFPLENNEIWVNTESLQLKESRVHNIMLINYLRGRQKDIKCFERLTIGPK